MDRRALMTLAGGMLVLPAAAQEIGISRALPDRFAEALNAHDIAAFAALFADDYVNHQKSAALPDPLTGKTAKEATVEFFKARLIGIPDLQVAVETVVASPDRAAASFVYSGSHEGPLFGIPATGRRLRFTSCDIFRLEDQRIVEHWGMGDIAGLLAEIRA